MKLILLSLLAATTAGAATVTAYTWTGNPTAIGVMPRQGVTVAGPRNIPLGTRVMIEGVGVRVVQDRTHKRFDGRWDVYFNSRKTAIQFGRRELQVTIIR